jgi:hypothetical protein
VVLNRSNRNLISDFGGGIKSDFTPYDGLIKELSEEVPFWQEEFMERLESSDPIVHSVEIYYPDNIRHSKEIIRTWTSIFLPIPKYLLNTFTETQEVKELIIIPVEKFSSFLVKNRRSINAGLNMLLKYYYFE